MTRHRARSFQLESLEGKQLLSTLHPAHHARSKPAPLVLNGTLKELEGQNVSGYSGELKSLGQVVANVYPQTNSPIVRHNCRHRANGSVTLSYNIAFESEQVGRNSELIALPYTVVSGTGAYTGAKGSGVLEETGPRTPFFSFDDSSNFESLMATLSLHTIRSA